MSVIRVVVDNRVRVLQAELPPEVRDAMVAGFEHTNPQNAKMKSLLQHKRVPVWIINKQEPPVITTWRAEGDWLTFPRGGLRRVTEALEAGGLDYEIEDCRTMGRNVSRETFVSIPDHRVKLWPHQARIVEQALELEQCIFRSGVGSGKTSALIAIAARLKVPTLVVVHSRALAEQWMTRLERELGLDRADIGEIKGGKVRLGPVTVAIQRTLAMTALTPAVLAYFGCVMLDETHMAAAASFFAAIDPFPARYRFGASDDHRRKDRKEFLVHDLFGEVGEDVDRGELIDGGHVLDVEVRAVPTEFRADWYGFPDGGGKEIDFVKLVKEMMADPARDELVIDILTREEPTEQALVLVHEREHAQTLHQRLVACGVAAGRLIGGADWEGEFKTTLAGLQGGAIRVGVGTYKAIGTGIDLPKVAVAVAVTPIASNEQFFRQVRGRVCRVSPGKAGARMYVLLDRNVYPIKHLENLIRWSTRVLIREDGRWMDVSGIKAGSGRHKRKTEAR